MRPMPLLTAAVFLLSAGGTAIAANPTRIAETGAFLLGNASRCGVADDRVVRAGKVIRELIVAAADDEQRAERRQVTLCRDLSGERAAGGQRAHADPALRTVVMQFERLEQFHDQTGADRGVAPTR